MNLMLKRVGPMADVSPLYEIERAVQERAKDISLDMASPDGTPQLRALINEEVARWSDDFKRGRRDFDLSDPTESPNEPSATSPATGRSLPCSTIPTCGRRW